MEVLTATAVELAGAMIEVTGAVLSTVEEMPDPESSTLCEIEEALLGRLRTPDRVPEPVGLKTTLAVQLAPGA
jgi:hypothetical protein